MDTVVDRDDRRDPAVQGANVVGDVQEVGAETAQLERYGEVLAEPIARRLVDDRKEVLGEVT